MSIFQPQLYGIEGTRHLSLESWIVALIHRPAEILGGSVELAQAQVSHPSGVPITRFMRVQLEQARRRCYHIRKSTTEPLRLRQCLKGTQMVRISSQNLLTGIHRVSPIE